MEEKGNQQLGSVIWLLQLTVTLPLGIFRGVVFSPPTQEEENKDHLRFLGNWPPTPPLGQNFALSGK